MFFFSVFFFFKYIFNISCINYMVEHGVYKVHFSFFLHKNIFGGDFFWNLFDAGFLVVFGSFPTGFR